MRRIPGSSKNLRKIIKSARDQGWEVTWSKNSHLRFKPADPDQPIIYAGTSPSDMRSERNFLSSLRRAGLKLPGDVR